MPTTGHAVRRRRSPGAAAALALLFTLWVACDDGDAARDAPPAPGAAPAGGPATAPEDRPDRVTDTIMIEGMAEPMELRLHEADDLDLPFSTYIPEDMAVEREGEPEAVRFVGEFGGQRNEDVFVHFVVYPNTMEEAEALAMLRGFESGRGIPVGRGMEPLGGDEEPPPIPWAIQAYDFRYQTGGVWYAGTAALGRRDGRHFHIIRHYPAEFGDGFGPRAEAILRHWRWEDGEPLTP